MRDNFSVFTKRRIREFNTFVINMFIFLPHFFSVGKMLQTLFDPWRNIVTVKAKPGFSFEEFGQRLSENFVSRFMGFFVRFSLIISYIVIQTVLVIFIPLTYIVFFITIPIQFSLYQSEPTEDERKKDAYINFVKRHLTEPAEKEKVDAWFNMYWLNQQVKPWWSLETLMSTAPLGRDLSYGFTNTLDQYATELTTQQPHYQHLIDRQNELVQIQQILSKSGEANVILIGEEGVGRKTIIEALGKLIFEGRTTPQLVYKRILDIDIQKIISEVTDKAQREEKLTELFREAAQAKNIIILIHHLDEFATSENGGFDISPVLEKFAHLPTVQFIATTTPYLYQKNIYHNKELMQFFDPIEVKEVTKEDALQILLDVSLVLEQKHGVSISYQALQQVVQKSHMYMTTLPLPEKAIEFLDEACLFAKMNLQSKAVTAHVINSLLEQKTHVPQEVTSVIKDKLINFEMNINKRIIHQEEPIKKLAAALRQSFIITGQRKKPLASFMFLGPTGVGKTETAKAITSTFFDSENKLMRFDMSLYQRKEDIAKLIGSSESGEPGDLSSALKEHRYGTLLLDEIEKAHKDLLNIFLTVIDEGYFTDAFGEKIDCTNIILIATSNAGAEFIYQKLHDQPEQHGDITDQLLSYLIEQRIFSPEFLNRFDGVIAYKPLNNESILQITRMMLQKTRDDLFNQQGIEVDFSDAYLQKIIQDGYNPAFGARSMQRVIRDTIVDDLAKKILAGEVVKGQKISY